MANKVSANVLRTGFSRMWLIQNGASPRNVPEYQGLWKAGAVSWRQGDITTIKVPDPGRHDGFVRIGKIKGDPGDPQMSVMARYTADLSRLLKLVKLGCDSDLQIHFGECKDPRDFNKGWEKVLILAAATPTDYGTGELGAIEPSQRAMIDETVPFTGEDYYEVGKLNFGEQAAAQITQEVVDILICDAIACGACGLPSDGCQVVLAATLRAGGSPGTGARMLYTQNGGSTWAGREITAFTGSNDPDSIGCVSTYVFVVSAELIGVAYATLADLLTGSETWTTVTTGFVAGGAPKANYVYDPSNIWIVGAGGYIYKSTDITAGVTVQDAGVATVQNLNAVHGIDQLHLVAVGASNAVVYSNNGGITWTPITGPAVGVALNTVWMASQNLWYIGTAGGKLYYTDNAGVTWTEVAFPGSGAGSVRDIKFATNAVGYMSHDTATPRGRVLRTIDGGRSWYVAPESGVAMNLGDRYNKLATCDPNIVFGAGLADSGSDGIIVKGAA